MLFRVSISLFIRILTMSILVTFINFLLIRLTLVKYVININKASLIKDHMMTCFRVNNSAFRKQFKVN